MADILLIAVNARYSHCAFAARSLLANLGPLRPRAAMLETDTDTLPFQLAADVAARQPRVAGFSVYLWNTTLVREALAILRRAAPGLHVVLGGPEITTAAAPAWEGLADILVVGEGETAFRNACAGILDGAAPPSAGLPAVHVARPEHPTALELPYDLYDGADLRHRSLYAESTRGCPCGCLYCTSAGTGLRCLPLDRLLPALERLLARGGRNLRFLDRSFNAGEEHACAVLDFFLARRPEQMRLHFELLPRLPGPALRARLAAFPAGSLHLEVGVQTLNDAVAARAGRGGSAAAAMETLAFLTRSTGAAVHADLIFGLPGEGPASFAAGFDRIVREAAPAELQVNLLKGLPGTPIADPASFPQLVFSPHPPYELLQSDTLDFAAIAALQRFARCWDLIHNRGRLRQTAARLWRDGASPFARVCALAERIQDAEGRLHALGADCVAAHLERALADTCHSV
jgi:radical SAM superfamily enzyme YgiQ (UPF0313 family)